MIINRITVYNKCIKIIAEIVVNMSILARIEFNCNLKNSTSEIGYYSYTKRWQQLRQNDENIH